MGSRDRPKHETKKPKKTASKVAPPPITTILPTPPTVEVIKKGKKAKEWETE